MESKGAFEHEHDWRLASEEPVRTKMPSGRFSISAWTRRWYCTRCRLVEERREGV